MELYWDIQNFQSPSQLLAFAGLEPSIHQSGQVDTAGHMVKRGPPHLRWALIQAARLSARFSPTTGAYLDKKLSEGKYFNVAITHVAKKLVRIIFFVLKFNQPFDEQKPR
ncbi:IS110 family transposase [Enterococcus faecalis]|uniref:Transposase IS116/IS110/IS902 C-terminal domain-containing protein n=1 Tax=Enterococcus faecalis RP2S-4 TaxID=1244145 RepID=A0ABC9TQG5_ENTFL|nr:IS110 family transposase [Enterococcus faecalis]EPI11646.1 hypothetical protein D358_00245 [Enterococcus faecalis RP2S-4]